ncbi:PLD nuclease N-terminal domain-containing protein [Agromyces larvae]|uniref:PLD nuclease N-terminal domain-containing protein n=1 Tax=Agromyces larvae TaxID=2929802 RepID=UPI00338E693B
MALGVLVIGAYASVLVYVLRDMGRTSMSEVEKTAWLVAVLFMPFFGAIVWFAASSGKPRDAGPAQSRPRK